MNKEQKEALKQGFLQLGISAIIYLLWIVLGFVSAITLGFILQHSIILLWVQGAITIFANLTGIYFSYTFLKSSQE